MVNDTPPLDETRRKVVRSMLEQEVHKTMHQATKHRAARRVAVIGSGVLVLAGVLVISPFAPGESGEGDRPLAPATAAAGVRFLPDGESLIAEITDPEASAAAMTAAFQERGINVEVTLVPAAPKYIGTVVMTSTSDWRQGEIREVAARAGCVTPSGAPCTTAIEIPAGFNAHGEVAIGRAPVAGEAIVVTD